MKRTRSSVLGLISATLFSFSPAFASPGERAVGSTHWVGEQYFQYLGRDEAGAELWLYPHLDGVFEVFTASADGWSGSLGSTFDPGRGGFRRRFGAAELANDLLAKDVSVEQRRRAARLLTLFTSLRPADEAPYYLQPAKRALRRSLGPAGAAWAQTSRRTQARLLARVARPGTRIFQAPTALRSSDDHYRALVSDGYLDVAVVGGNSENKETGEFHSNGMVADLVSALERMGFRSAPGLEGSGRRLCEKTVRFFGHPVRVRVRLTPAGRTGASTRRAVTNFVEGIAQSDVVIYFGHSNEGSGYYLSERKDDYSRIRIGPNRGGSDLGNKCYGVGRKAHQIVALHSCLSYERYCAPMRSFYDEDDSRSTPGFVGTSNKAHMGEFAPRFARFLQLLVQGAGPRELAREVNAIRLGPKTPALLFRGVLQPRHSFVVPRGVTILATEERGPEQGFVVEGRGSDGEVYDSTEVFPQDHLGEIVQVVPQPRGVYGVSRDGRLLSVSRETEGAPVEVVVPRTSTRRIIFAAWVKRQSKTRLTLLDSEGRVRHLSRSGDRLISPRHALPPAGVHFVALGNARDGRVVALDDAGGAYASILRRWKLLDEPVEISATPSLLWGESELWAHVEVAPGLR